jgi:hypothetical protein
MLAGPVRVQMMEEPEGGRKLIIQPDPYTVYAVPFPPELAQDVGRDLQLSNEEFQQQAEEESERQKAADRLIVPPGARNGGAA